MMSRRPGRGGKDPGSYVFFWGQLKGLSSPLAPPWPQLETSRGPWVPEEKHLGPHHPWTWCWAVYLGLAAWQLYWCYIQAHRDPESKREQDLKEWAGGKRRRAGQMRKRGVERMDVEWWGQWAQDRKGGGSRGMGMRPTGKEERERELWGSESVGLLWS